MDTIKVKVNVKRKQMSNGIAWASSHKQLFMDFNFPVVGRDCVAPDYCSLERL